MECLNHIWKRCRDGCCRWLIVEDAEAGAGAGVSHHIPISPSPEYCN